MASRGLNLNVVQVSAGLLATLTGAIAASYLGVGGTLVGAAVGSLASTVGGEVYKHYLERTHERLRGAVDVRRYRNARSGRSAVVGPVDPEVAQNRLGVTARRPEDGEDAAATQVLHVRGAGAPGQGGVTAPRTPGPNDPRPDSPTETFAAADGRSRAVPPAAAAAGLGWWRTRPRWLVLTAITVGTFLVALAVITVIELSVGKTLHAIVTNRSGTGTTLGGVVGGKTAPAVKQTATPTPSSTPSVTPSASVVVSPTPSTSSSGLAPTSSPAATLTPGDPNVPAPTS